MSRIGFLQFWQRSAETLYRQAVALLCCLGNGQWGGAQERPANVTGDVHRAGLRYLVRVEDSTTDGKGEAKPTALIYSKVADILNVERP